MKKIIIIFLLLATCVSVWSQTLKSVTVSGIILDETEQPVIGATVLLKDRPGIGTFSDDKGKFEIKATEGDILAVTMIGYRTYEYLIKDNTKDLQVRLSPKEEELTEAVVTGMGATQRKISLVGAITTVEVDQLKSPATSIPNMLGGRAAGII